ncbi:ATP-dependent DNA ligase [Gorgonomyces haynaldii]|nr:ATP-dependent DNA ligase [Gorgonomyces haynaldii]
MSNHESISYKDLCETFGKIEDTTKRLQIQSMLTDFFERVIQQSPKSLLECVYLCLNRVGPEYEGKELGLGESLLIKAIAQSTGKSTQAVKSLYESKGDLGLVAQSCKSSQQVMFQPKALTTQSVFKMLKDISNMSGKDSQSRKVSTIQKMLVACTGNEPKYLIRSLEGKLRIGLAQQTILISLSHAIALQDQDLKKKTPETKQARLQEAVAVVKQVYSELPSYDIIVPALLEHGWQTLPEHCQLTPGIPLKPMLAHPTKSITEVLDRFEGMDFTCEYKYDGERAQIHKLENGQVMIYSRNSENLSEKYPDIIQRIPSIAKEGTSSFVLDCEAVAWDRVNKCILPFQVLSTRKRKDVQTQDIQVQVCVFAFDILYLNGKALVQETLEKRRELMKSHLEEVDGEFLFAKSMEANTVDAIQTFLDESVVGNCEGLMVKTLNKESSYEPSKRSRNWLKVKKDYVNGVGDSLDLVVLGGYVGRGKRTGVYGGYLLGCYDDENEEYQSICKIGTGFSEEDLQKQFEFFKPHILDQPKPYYKFGDNPNVRPDVWFEPVQVWEVKAADLSISPVHKAASGIVDPEKGISLRFPRFIRIRDDKTPEQATNATQVADMYKNQAINSKIEDVDDD